MRFDSRDLTSMWPLFDLARIVCAFLSIFAPNRKLNIKAVRRSFWRSESMQNHRISAGASFCRALFLRQIMVDDKSATLISNQMKKISTAARPDCDTHGMMNAARISARMTDWLCNSKRKLQWTKRKRRRRTTTMQHEIRTSLLLWQTICTTATCNNILL